MKTRIFLIVSFLVFAVGVAAYPWQGNKTSQVEPQVRRPFQLTLHESTISADGKEALKAVRVQEVDERGYWEQTRTPVGKSGETKIQHTPEGYTASRGTDSLPLLAHSDIESPAATRPRAREFYVSRPDFVGTETIAGLTAYRLRNPSPDRQGEWVELAYALETFTLPIRLIHHFEDGTELRVEAVKITFK